MCDLENSRRLKLYGRRKGHRISDSQQQLFDDLLPGINLQELVGEQDGLIEISNTTWLEIGFGGGEHLISRALAHPEITFIGCEPFTNGVAKLLSSIAENDVGNIKVWPDDARLLLTKLPDQSIERVFLLYPDPWPKNRHRKRRFVNPENISELARILRPNGQFLFASDIEDYCEWTISHVVDHDQFTHETNTIDLQLLPPEGWPGTRYEQKALQEGRRPRYLRFVRSLYSKRLS